jgi:hypothetical protein
MTRISFCIPCYEAHGKGYNYLLDVFYALNNQVFKDFNVWISDQSKDDKVYQACEEYADCFEINYIKYQENIGNVSANTNNAIKYADGEILKIHYQDDFILTENLTFELDKVFVNDVEWAVSCFAHSIDDGRTHYNAKTPYWNDKILEGVNTFSSPSILAMRKDLKVYFDQNITLLLDCDMFYQLYIKYGEPIIMTDVHISNREHANQTQRKVEHLLSTEIEYLKRKYDRI